MKIHTLRDSRFPVFLAMAVLAIPVGGSVRAAPPLPVHTVEGVGGAAITPLAYLVNPEPRCEGAVFGKPAITLTSVNMGHKNLTAFSVTETFAGRVEFGYAADRLGLGTLPGDIRDATTLDCGRNEVWLHNFNVRVLAVKENTCLGCVQMPAVTAGVHCKLNDGIGTIDHCLAGSLSGIGYERENGVDFTLTATRTIPPEVLGRPLIVTAGLRASQAAQLGFLGFGDEYHTTFEGSVVYLPFDWLAVAYEFRQKPDPYSQIPGLVGDEDHWHALDAVFILGEHATFTAGYGNFGTIANTEEDGVWWLQLKYEL